MAYILDTDHLSILQEGTQPACERLRQRLSTVPPDDVATTIISFQEQFQGWIALLNQAGEPRRVVLAYAKLEKLVRSFSMMNVHSFSDAALARFAELRKRCRRVRAMDLRIASIALETDSVLLTRNLRDFRQVPGLRFEDWTAA